MLNLHDILNHHDLPLTKEVEKINDFLVDHLSSYRYEHSLKTVEFALRLAVRDHLDNKWMARLVIAALAHDITKENPAEFHLNLFKKYNRKDFADLPKALFHSKSAPYILQEEFNIQDDLISHAIMYHSTGCSDMSLFSRIIFCADFLASQGGSNQIKMLNNTLLEICIEKSSSTISYLLSQKLPVQPESINFYNVLIDESNI